MGAEPVRQGPWCRMAVSTVSGQVEVELVSGRFAGPERLKFRHQNGKETVARAH